MNQQTRKKYYQQLPLSLINTRLKIDDNPNLKKKLLTVNEFKSSKIHWEG